MRIRTALLAAVIAAVWTAVPFDPALAAAGLRREAKLLRQVAAALETQKTTAPELKYKMRDYAEAHARMTRKALKKYKTELSHIDMLQEAVDSLARSRAYRRLAIKLARYRAREFKRFAGPLAKAKLGTRGDIKILRLSARELMHINKSLGYRMSEYAETQAKETRTKEKEPVLHEEIYLLREAIYAMESSPRKRARKLAKKLERYEFEEFGNLGTPVRAALGRRGQIRKLRLAAAYLQRIQPSLAAMLNEYSQQQALETRARTGRAAEPQEIDLLRASAAALRDSGSKRAKKFARYLERYEKTQFVRLAGPPEKASFGHRAEIKLLRLSAAALREEDPLLAMKLYTYAQTRAQESKRGENEVEQMDIDLLQGTLAALRNSESKRANKLAKLLDRLERRKFAWLAGKPESAGFGRRGDIKLLRLAAAQLRDVDSDLSLRMYAYAQEKARATRGKVEEAVDQEQIDLLQEAIAGLRNSDSKRAQGLAKRLSRYERRQFAWLAGRPEKAGFGRRGDIKLLRLAASELRDIDSDVSFQLFAFAQEKARFSRGEGDEMVEQEDIDLLQQAIASLRGSDSKRAQKLAVRLARYERSQFAWLAGRPAAGSFGHRGQIKLLRLAASELRDSDPSLSLRLNSYAQQQALVSKGEAEEQVTQEEIDLLQGVIAALRSSESKRAHKLAKWLARHERGQFAKLAGPPAAAGFGHRGEVKLLRLAANELRDADPDMSMRLYMYAQERALASRGDVEDMVTEEDVALLQGAIAKLQGSDSGRARKLAKWLTRHEQGQFSRLGGAPLPGGFGHRGEIKILRLSASELRYSHPEIAVKLNAYAQKRALATTGEESDAVDPDDIDLLRAAVAALQGSDSRRAPKLAKHVAKFEKRRFAELVGPGTPASFGRRGEIKLLRHAATELQLIDPALGLDMSKFADKMAQLSQEPRQAGDETDVEFLRAISGTLEEHNPGTARKLEKYADKLEKRQAKWNRRGA